MRRTRTRTRTGGSSAYPGTYTGFVATRTVLCRSQNTTSKQLNARTRHVCQDDVTSIRLVYSNFLAVSGSENAPGATATVKASVEYPDGVFTRVQFSSVDTGTISDGGYIISDPVSVSIPRDGSFRTWVFWNSTAGIIFNERGANTNVATGEAMQHAASGLTDQTMGGTITHTGGTNGYGPAAIIGTTNRASFLFLGDSKFYGRDDSFSGAELFSGEVARSFANTYGWCNAGIGSTKATQLVTEWDTADAAFRKAMVQYCSHVITNLSINDFSAGETSTQVVNNLKTLAGLCAGKPFIVATITPETTSTDSWATTVNQTVANASQNTGRVAFNNVIRSSLPTEFAAYVEIADTVESARDSGLWKASHTADGLHQTRTGHVAIVTAGAIVPDTLAALRP